jgi:ABC-2 type transport system ATP-binding protein
MASSDAAVYTSGLTKQYIQNGVEITALQDLSIEVRPGEIYGFLGPNGAGKTTTIKTLLGLIFPTAGEAYVFGHPAGSTEMKKLVSYLPENPYFYDYLTGVELLDFYGRLFKIPVAQRDEKIQALLELVGLQNDSAKTLRQYSKGMLQRIGIAQALLNDPQLLILDEPTSGLDPIAHIEIRDLILRLKKEGKTVFLTSHLLSDVEMVCDRVAILHRGRLVRTGHVSEMVMGGRVEIQARGVTPTTVERLRSLAPDLVQNDGMIQVVQDEGEGVNQVIDAIRGDRADILAIIPLRRTLEEIFVETVQKERVGTAVSAGKEANS